MGNYRCRRPGYLSALQIVICEHVFQGKSDNWILENDYHTDMKDPKAVNAARKRLWNLRKHPRFIEYYNSILTEFRVHGYGKAMHKLTDLIDDQNPWVAIQASNSVLARTDKAVTGEDENTVTVKIEGMPDIGTPDTEETDGEE